MGKIVYGSVAGSVLIGITSSSVAYVDSKTFNEIDEERNNTPGSLYF